MDIRLGNSIYLIVKQLWYGLSTEQICSSMENYPNLISLVLSDMSSNIEVFRVAQVTILFDSKLSVLTIIRESQAQLWEILTEILNRSKTPFKKIITDSDYDITNMMLTGFRRHAATLTSIQYASNVSIKSQFVQFVLFESSILEKFTMERGDFSWDQAKSALTVPETVEMKRESSKIKRWEL